MTVGELKSLLSGFSDDMEIVTKASNSRYVDGIANVKKMELTAYWGADRDVLVLLSSGQEGAVQKTI